jgi:hypothetical protein
LLFVGGWELDWERKRKRGKNEGDGEEGYGYAGDAGGEIRFGCLNGLVVVMMMVVVVMGITRQRS